MESTRTATLDHADEYVDDGAAEGVEHDMYLVFMASDQEYGIRAMNVQEISAMVNVTRIPRSPAHIEGILNLRGRLVSVVNFRRRFGLDPIPATEDTRIIIMDHQGFPVGLVADRVQEVIRIPDEKVRELPEAAVAAGAEDYVAGIGMLEDRLIVLLDVERLVSATEGADAEALSKAGAALSAAAVAPTPA